MLPQLEGFLVDGGLLLIIVEIKYSIETSRVDPSRLSDSFPRCCSIGIESTEAPRCSSPWVGCHRIGIL